MWTCRAVFLQNFSLFTFHEPWDELFEHPAELFFTGSARCASRALGGFVNAWNARAYPAENFIGDRADPAGHFISPD